MKMNQTEIKTTLDKIDTEILHTGLKKIYGEIADEIFTIQKWDLYTYFLACQLISKYSTLDKIADNIGDFTWPSNIDYLIKRDLLEIIKNHYSDFLEKNNIEIDIYDRTIIKTNLDNDEKTELELSELLEILKI